MFSRTLGRAIPFQDVALSSNRTFYNNGNVSVLANMTVSGHVAIKHLKCG